MDQILRKKKEEKNRTELSEALNRRQRVTRGGIRLPCSERKKTVRGKGLKEKEFYQILLQGNLNKSRSGGTPSREDKEFEKGEPRNSLDGSSSKAIGAEAPEGEVN